MFGGQSGDIFETTKMQSVYADVIAEGGILASMGVSGGPLGKGESVGGLSPAQTPGLSTADQVRIAQGS